MRDLVTSASRLQNVSPEETVNALFSMNNAMLKVCIASIKQENPDISEKDLLKELKRIYGLRR